MTGIFILFLTTVNDILYAQNISKFIFLQSLVPLGLFIFTFFQSYILSVRFAQAFTIANTDELTHICNRRRFLELSEKIFIAAQKGNQAISLLFMDLDHFKRVNDSYGHETGDLVLKNFAAIIKSVVEPHDIVGRMGGEEFAIIVYGGNEAALKIGEEIRRNTEETEIVIDKTVLRITVSIGISTNEEEQNISLKKMFKTADQALYKAKENGRNRIEFRDL